MSKQKPHVVVVGSSNTDMVIAGSSLPKPGQTLTGGTFYIAAGGKGANQAVAAARSSDSNTRVTFLGAFGDDDLGRTAIRGLKSDGIDCKPSVTLKNSPSGVALILVGAEGENMISVAAGANFGLEPSHVRKAKAIIKGADVLLTQLESPIETVAAALAVARSAGVMTILNPAPAPKKPLPRSLLANIDVLTPNETEFAAITGTSIGGRKGEAAAKQLASTLGGALIVTVGAAGARVYTHDGGETHVGAFRVKPVDTVAAGDAFSGALALALAERMELPLAIRFASAVAALSVTKRGAQPSLPMRREVKRFLKDARSR